MLNEPLVNDDSFMGDLLNGLFMRAPYRKPNTESGGDDAPKKPTHKSKDFEEGPPTEQDGLGVA